MGSGYCDIDETHVYWCVLLWDACEKLDILFEIVTLCIFPINAFLHGYTHHHQLSVRYEPFICMLTHTHLYEKMETLEDGSLVKEEGNNIGLYNKFNI